MKNIVDENKPPLVEAVITDMLILKEDLIFNGHLIKEGTEVLIERPSERA